MSTLLDQLDAPLPTARPRNAPSSRRSALPPPVSVHPLLRRRVLAFDEYVEEVRLSKDERMARFGSAIPVPLAPGQTVAQYEARFREWLAEREVTMEELKHSPNRERTFRCNYALQLVRSLEHAHDEPPQRPKPEYITLDGRIDSSKVPHHLTVLSEYLSMDEYTRERLSGRIARLSQLTLEEKQRIYGTPYTPIFVPLAPDETKEQYEERFCQWLEKEHKTTLTKVQHDYIRLRERRLRMDFAALSSQGIEKFVSTTSHKRARVVEDNVRGEKKPKITCGGRDSVESCRVCGCPQCLVTAMRLLSEKIESLECNVKCNQHEPMQLVDLTTDGNDPSKALGKPESDGIEHELVQEYETINEIIVINEHALDASAKGLVELAVAKQYDEALRRGDEDRELREMIDEESDRRSVALATLVVYLYRQDLGEFTKIINAKEATNTVYLQKLSHSKCAQLAVDICAIRTQLDAVKGVETDHDKEERELQGTMDRLVEQRRHQWLTTVRFDARAREAVQTILSRVQSA